MRLTEAALATALCLSVAGCAGTPPPGQQAGTGHTHSCQRITGSFLCSEPDEQGLSSNNSPTDSLPGSNLSQGASSGGRH